MSRSVTLLAVLLFGAGCVSAPHYDIGQIDLSALAAEQDLQTAELDAMKARVDSLFLPLIRNGTPMCRDVGPYYGFTVLTNDMFSDGLERDLAEVRGIGFTPYVNSVAPTSRAEAAGLLPGDKIHAVDGRTVRSSGAIDSMRLNAARRPGRTEIPWTITDALDRADTPTPFSVWRESESDSLEIVIEPELTCPYRASVIEGDINAYADGTNVFVTRGMIDFVESDEELQFVLAHELAHNGASHLDAMRNNSILGTILGATVDAALGTHGVFSAAGQQAGLRSYSQDFEREADYLAAYFLARARVDLSGLEAFWRRMAEGAGYQSLNPSRDGSHPSYPERALRLQSVVLEIEAKRRRMESILPNQRR